jgi:hypothetical protein
VVKEFGAVFATRADSIAWRRLVGVEHIAADHITDRMFILSDSLRGQMLDHNLRVLWSTRERVDGDVEQVQAWNGTGYVSTSKSMVLVARDGAMRTITPRAKAQ